MALNLISRLVILRFFSVYGPRQRPDIGYYKFIYALLMDSPITVFGDGTQVRGNTYIDDGVGAIVASLQAPVGATYNVGGDETANVWEILSLLERICQSKANVQMTETRPGDQISTKADTTRFTIATGWRPETSLEQGLTQQYIWQKQMLGK